MARNTRFAGLQYRMDALGLWRFVDLSTDASIGPHYPTKAELLADMDRYALSGGWATAVPTTSAIVDYTDKALLNECYEMLMWVRHHKEQADLAKDIGAPNIPVVLNVAYVEDVCTFLELLEHRLGLPK